MSHDGVVVFTPVTATKSPDLGITVGCTTKKRNQRWVVKGGGQRKVQTLKMVDGKVTIVRADKHMRVEDLMIERLKDKGKKVRGKTKTKVKKKGATKRRAKGRKTRS